MEHTPRKARDDEIENLELINEEIRHSLDKQSDAITKIDTKAVVLVGYTVAVLSFLVTRHPQLELAISAYVAFALAIASGIFSYAVGKFKDAPEPRNLFQAYMLRSKAETLAAIAATRVFAFERNAVRQRMKVQAWRVSLVALAVGVVLMLLSILVQTG